MHAARERAVALMLVFAWRHANWLPDAAILPRQQQPRDLHYRYSHDGDATRWKLLLREAAKFFGGACAAEVLACSGPDDMLMMMVWQSNA